MTEYKAAAIEDCPCCYDSFRKCDMFQCRASLGHRVCKDCISNYVDEEVNGKNSIELQCFVVNDCHFHFSEDSLSKALSKEMKERVDQAMFREAVGKIDDVW